MSFASSFAIGVSLSVDSFSAALGANTGRRPSLLDALVAALPFVVFEVGALTFGWTAGRAAEPYVAAVDHWIAFGLLGWIGLRMIADAVRSGARPPKPAGATQARRLLTALGASVDSAVVGMTLALAEIGFAVAAAAMALATLLMAGAGAIIGGYAAHRIGRWSEAAGGAVLIMIGTRILIQHLGL